MAVDSDPFSKLGVFYSINGYVEWRAGNGTIKLDGDFTSSELRALADYMEAHTNKDDGASQRNPPLS